MNITRGFNSEYGRYKFDVMIEEGDLARLLMEHHIPVEQAPLLTCAEAYQVMCVEADILVNNATVKYLDSEGRSEDSIKLKEQAGVLQQHRKTLLAGVRDRLADESHG
jgi:hypothetical protein